MCTTAILTEDSGRPRHTSTRQVGQSLRTTYPPPPPGHTFPGLCPRPAQAPSGRQEATEHPGVGGGGGGGRPPATCSLGSTVAALRPRLRRPATLAGAGCLGGRAPAVPVGVREPSRPGIRPPAGPAPSRPRARKQRQRGTVEAHGELAALAVVLHADGAALLQRARRCSVRHRARRDWGPRAAAN